MPIAIRRIHSRYLGDKALPPYDREMGDADRIIAQLRKYAVSTAKLLIEARENSNAIVTKNHFPAVDAYKSSIIQSLKEIGEAPETITEVEQSDSHLVLNFYSYAAFRFASDGFLPEEKKRAEFDKAFSALSVVSSNHRIRFRCNTVDSKLTAPSGRPTWRISVTTLEQRSSGG
jgi:hypothetical protein